MAERSLQNPFRLLLNNLYNISGSYSQIIFRKSSILIRTTKHKSCHFGSRGFRKGIAALQFQIEFEFKAIRIVRRGVRGGARRCVEVHGEVRGGAWKGERRYTKGCADLHGGVRGGVWTDVRRCVKGCTEVMWKKKSGFYVN